MKSQSQDETYNSILTPNIWIIPRIIIGLTFPKRRLSDEIRTTTLEIPFRFDYYFLIFYYIDKWIEIELIWHSFPHSENHMNDITLILIPSLWQRYTIKLTYLNREIIRINEKSMMRIFFQSITIYIHIYLFYRLYHLLIYLISHDWHHLIFLISLNICYLWYIWYIRDIIRYIWLNWHIWTEKCLEINEKINDDNIDNRSSSIYIYIYIYSILFYHEYLISLIYQRYHLISLIELVFWIERYLNFNKISHIYTYSLLFIILRYSQYHIIDIFIIEFDIKKLAYSKQEIPRKLWMNYD